ESREQRVLSLRQLRGAVVRDLAWLLNTGPLSGSGELDMYPHAAHSVINYGSPDLTGLTPRQVDLPGIERAVRQAIQAYEPRLLRNSVTVKIEVDEEQACRNAITFKIEAHLWAQPAPEHLYLETELDLENGHVTVKGNGS
ncbi:MAG: type VI secretion system baseplate subunit TssE, partial [Gammaproteobacteria bacterium]